MTGPVLLLAPSRGLGGGIERYVQAVQAAFDDESVPHQRLDLARPGLAGHRHLLAEATAALAKEREPARLVAAHRALLPVAAALARTGSLRGISVICHGSDVWGIRTGPRWQLESWLMRRRDVRIVAVSSFTAGALVPARAALAALAGLPGRNATVLPPGLARQWYGQLVSAAERQRAPHAGLELMTAFRLDDWRDKGLPQLTAAVAALGAGGSGGPEGSSTPGGIRLTVCGSGTPSRDLLAHVRRFPWCTLRPGLTDRELAGAYAAADLFVLATRTRSGHAPCGEGFGMVLMEAQVAGTAVVGPAHGGSLDAYLDGVTGQAPRDESVAALAGVLARLASQPGRVAEMGRLGAAWARLRFDPGRYAALAVDRLL